MNKTFPKIQDMERVPLEEICPRPRCGQRMAVVIQEHALLHRCHCGYSSITVNGETKLAYAEARGGLHMRRMG